MFKSRIQQIIFVALIVLTVYSFWPRNSITTADLKNWNFALNGNGKVQFMGIVIGKSTLEEAEKLLNSAGSYAMFIDKQKPVLTRQVEAFYEEVREQGTLVLLLETNDDIAQAIEKTAKSPYVYPNGTVKISIEKSNLDIIKNQIVNSITFIPHRKIDSKLFEQQFGAPERIVNLQGQVHNLYPALGLDITRSDEDSDVLQIVDPGHFDKLLTPLTTS